MKKDDKMVNINGLMLIDAPHSALNNAGSDTGHITDNTVKVKCIWKNNIQYPYVSGQAFRYWLRETLKKNFNWDMSPINREKKIAFTEANPIIYPDDDMFGYMRALKKKDGGTVTRISPFKNSPLISVVGQTPTNDFGVMARQDTGNPVPFEHEFYSTVLKGIFSIDISSIGVFSETERLGYRNMYPRLIEFAEKRGLKNKDGQWILDDETRIKRTQNIINALPYLSGGAKNTTHLTDVSPKIVVLAAIESGNNIFMNIIYEKNNQIVFDIEALDEVINDYKDILKTDVYIGLRRGFLEEIKNDIIEYGKSKSNVHVGSIKEITDKFSNEIPKLI